MSESKETIGSLAVSPAPRFITIPAATQGQARKLRVAAYARVSSDSDDQLHSYAAQNAYFTKLIISNPDWDFVDVYPDAMSLLLGDDLGGSYPAAKEKVPEPANPFALPPQSESMRRVYAYLLQKRCIDREILNAFVRKKLIYESCERSRDGTKEYHNAVFVGFDEHGVPRHGHKRGLYTMGQSYRGNIEGSDPRHSFHYLGGDDTLYVFEAPIDLLSYLSLFPEGWQEHNYVACCGTSSIPVLEMLRQLPQLRQVYLCLDNDAAGHAASERMAKLLEERGISAERLVPQQKDWNDDLKAEQENKMERSELCQTFC